ncbi:hypothetical protein DFJ73DRAFT_764033 [Zopfochytrium polystomum]|nr:hypothetical protein DFJ73DRAFT_764033 [Zopfochytrium polystomum]
MGAFGRRARCTGWNPDGRGPRSWFGWDGTTTCTSCAREQWIKRKGAKSRSRQSFKILPCLAWLDGIAFAIDVASFETASDHVPADTLVDTNGMYPRFVNSSINSQYLFGSTLSWNASGPSTAAIVGAPSRTTTVMKLPSALPFEDTCWNTILPFEFAVTPSFLVNRYSRPSAARRNVVPMKGGHRVVHVPRFRRGERGKVLGGNADLLVQDHGGRVVLVRGLVVDCRGKDHVVPARRRVVHGRGRPHVAGLGAYDLVQGRRGPVDEVAALPDQDVARPVPLRVVPIEARRAVFLVEYLGQPRQHPEIKGKHLSFLQLTLEKKGMQKAKVKVVRVDATVGRGCRLSVNGRSRKNWKIRAGEVLVQNSEIGNYFGKCVSDRQHKGNNNHCL